MDPMALKRLLDSSGLSDLADLSKSLVVAAALGDREAVQYKWGQFFGRIF